MRISGRLSLLAWTEGKSPGFKSRQKLPLPRKVYMRTVAIINQKGGCGKTTTSINLAACMAQLGHKTLLVDMDPQGHCGVGLAVPEEQIERTIYDALIEASDGKPADIGQIVWQIASDFDLAPSNIRLAAFEQVFAHRAGRDERLKSALDRVRSNYQWTVIDCPPSVGLLTFNALKAADQVIVPVETGFFSLHGLAKMMDTLDVMRQRCGKDITIRILPTLYDTRTKLAREVLSELRVRFRQHLMESTVNFNTKLKEAASFGQPITEYDPGSRGYKDFVNLARELMGHNVAEPAMAMEEKLSRPAELVQRAKQLSQLANVQFGKPAAAPAPAASVPPPLPKPLEIKPPPAIPALPQTITGFSTPMLRLTEDLWPPATELLLSNRPFPSIVTGNDRSEGPRVSLSVSLPSVPETKTTQQKIEEFYGVKQVGAEVIFAAHFDRAKSVLLAGDFNNWTPQATPLANGTRPGDWRTALPLPPGRYKYRLVVDGKWITDPHNRYVEANQFGELDNVIEVSSNAASGIASIAA
jgi:chromosome partitioning protein